MSINPDDMTDNQALDALLLFAQDALRDHVARLSHDRAMGRSVHGPIVDLFRALISRAYDLRTERLIHIRRKPV